MLDAPFLVHLSKQLGCAIDRYQSVSGGDINQSFCLESENHQQRFFLKNNHTRYREMFAAEAVALKVIHKTQSVRVPAVIALGEYQEHSFLVLEYLPLQTGGNDSALGTQLAQMHRHTAEQFGFQQDNFIGTTPQSNQQHSHWLTFWREQRLIPQLELAYKNGHRQALESQASSLLERLPDLLQDHQPQASLLHGDLWSGNAAFFYDKGSSNAQSVIYDPASYYGDRETDIAMTRLFGGFSQGFYRAYQEEWPLPAGFEQRQTLYNLYHILNHLNLFGGSYLNACIKIIKDLL